MNEELAALADEYWEALLEAQPTTATFIGDYRYADRFEHASREAEDELISRLDSFASRAQAIDAASLGPDERVTRDVLLFEASTRAKDLRSRDLEINIGPMLGIHIQIIQGIPQLRPPTREVADALVAKAGKTGTLFDQTMARHLEGVANGRTPPLVAVGKALSQIDAYLATPTESDPFLQITPPTDMSDAEVRAWRDAMSDQVTGVVRPAFGRYRDGIAEHIRPVARPQEKSGVCWLPDGEEVYGRAMARFTSLDVTADEVHQIGLDGIAALEEEYAKLGGSVLGTSDVAEVYQRLRDDPALRFETAEQVQQAAQRALERANAATPDWFGRLPQAPCIVQPIPEVGAEDATLAYYFPPAEDGTRPGIFFINLSEPTSRTRYESEALAFHEAVPGHHLQLSIAQEIEGMPAFRRHALVTVYVEGWGLYTERLSDEMGLYSGDLERLGILSFDSWRAGRLVVDTGMHAKGWSRQQAIDFLVENSPQAPNNIANEVDRYIAWPGQALAYKMGQREIFRLREEARSALGDRFDIKAFHDTVLGSGPVPLGLLGDLVREWAAAGG